MRLAQLSQDDGNVLGVMLFSERICQQTATANLTGFVTFLHIMRDDEISGYLVSRSQECRDRADKASTPEERAAGSKLPTTSVIWRSAGQCRKIEKRHSRSVGIGA
jgi:hypothetical protein